MLTNEGILSSEKNARGFYFETETGSVELKNKLVCMSVTYSTDTDIETVVMLLV